MKIVIGTNFMAWLAAIGLKKHRMHQRVLLASFGSQVGGNSQSFKFKNQFVDRGMQTFYECGIEWADDIVREALQESNIEFNEFPWPHHDPCLTWQHGQLYDSVYPVHRSKMSLEDYEKEFSRCSEHPTEGDGLIENMVSTFGKNIWDNVFYKIATKFSVGDLSDLSIASLAPLPTDRILAPHLSDRELRNKPGLISKIAFSNPTNIPKSQSKVRSTIYPKQGGIRSLIFALRNLAIIYGVEVRENISWDQLKVSKGRLTLGDFTPEQVLWTLPNRQLSRLVDTGAFVPPPAPFTGSHLVAYIKGGLNTKNAHYLLSYDDDAIFRITFYGNLVGKSASTHASVELLIPPESVNEDQILEFFYKCRLIDKREECAFSPPSPSPWPISFPKGYTEKRGFEEKFLIEKIPNLVLLNSNPAKASVMQTPTLFNRLQWFQFQ